MERITAAPPAQGKPSLKKWRWALEPQGSLRLQARSICDGCPRARRNTQAKQAII